MRFAFDDSAVIADDFGDQCKSEARTRRFCGDKGVEQVRHQIFRHAAWYYGWLRPVPFTQKQLRLDIDALEKRYRERGYFGVRVTTDFSMLRRSP